MSKIPINILSAKSALNENYVLILTTNSTERVAVNERLESRTRAVIPLETRGASLGLIDNHFCIHLTGDSGASATVNAGRFARLMTNNVMPKPALIILLGFGWGNPNRVAIGDVVLSTAIENISHQRVVNGTDLRRKFTYTSPLGDLSELCAELTRVSQRQVHAGTLASSELYLGDDQYRDAILSQIPDVLGGEMEAFDVVKDLVIPWVVLKGVSDFGDSSTDMVHQVLAAGNAADIIADLLEALVHNEQLTPPLEHPSAKHLRDTLKGRSILISRPPGDHRQVTEALDQTATPALITRLAGYASDGDPEGALPHCLGVLMAEVAQNAFLHGDATAIRCEYTETTISMTDDAHHFDISHLIGSRGGAAAWASFERLFSRGESIKYTHLPDSVKGNKYTFKLKMLTEEIRRTRTQCTVVASYSGPGSQPFSYDESCSALYYDATGIFMTSRRLNAAFELKNLIASGRKLYIACRDMRQVDEISNDLAEFEGPQLKIFVASRI